MPSSESVEVPQGLEGPQLLESPQPMEGLTLFCCVIDFFFEFLNSGAVLECCLCT